MQDLQLAVKYLPYIMFDHAEPFCIDAIGYTVIHQTGNSPSFRRQLEVDPQTMAFVVEYAIYFDYDIQHLYDLEHIWVSVGHDGEVCDVQASFHGKYFNAMLPQYRTLHDQTHFEIFCQPGKHAFLPHGQLFRLIPGWDTACNIHAGQAGLLVMDMFSESLHTTPQIQQRVMQYIRTQYSFSPTLQFEHRPVADALLMPWQHLKMLIPQRINHQLELIFT